MPSRPSCPIVVVVASGLCCSCVGLSAGGTAGVSVSHRGRMRYDLAAPLSMAFRGYNHATTANRAAMGLLGATPLLTYRPDVAAFGGGAGMTVGGSAFWGSMGTTGLVTLGGLADPDRFGTHQGRFFARFQAGLEVDTSTPDWRIQGQDNLGFCSRTLEHRIASILAGVEYVASHGDTPSDWYFSLGLGFRGLWEPPCAQWH